MIELQTALAIAGLVVFIIVLIISYDKYRLHKIRDRETRIQSRDGPKEPELPQDISVNVEPPQTGNYSLISPTAKGSIEEVSAGPRLIDPLEQELDDVGKIIRTPIHGVTTFDAFPEEEPAGGLQIELVARIPGNNPIKRDTALGLYRQHEFELKMPRRIFGLSQPGGVWMNLEQAPADAMFTDFGISIQLADRTGPISETEINTFSQIVLRFAEVFGRRFSFSMEIDEALKHARDLDELCKKYDALVILNVLTRDSGFKGEDVDKHARELGMRMTRRRIYEKAISEKNHVRYLYSLANLYGDGHFDEVPGAAKIGGITLFMNIPRTRSPNEVFDTMVADAKDLCRRLDGKLVDQNKRSMTENGIKAISEQIKRIASEMESDGIEPGGTIASRLF